METVKTETVSSSDFAGRILLRQELLFWITACVLLFIFLDTAGLRDGELFRAEVCREMLLTRSWFQPVFNWETVNNISFLGYWLTAPFIWLFGYTEAAVRMPGVLAALACLYGVRMTGKVLFNEKIAYMAGWMLLGSVGFLLWGRSGSTAMPGMAASILAVGWFFRMEGKSVFFTMLIFYLLCFAGVLCSSISALFVPVTVVFSWCFAVRDKAPNWYLKNLGAFCTAALFFVFLTFLPVLLSENRTAEAAEVLKNLALNKNAWLFTPADWREYGHSCLWYLPKMLLPWSPLLLAGAAGLVKNWNNLSAGIRASAAGSILAVIICILTFKEQSLLAAVPLVLLLGCGGLTGPGANKWIFPAVSIIYYAMLIFSSVFFCSVIAYPLWRKLIAFSPPLPLLLWPAAMGALAWFALFLDHRRNSILTVATGLPHRLGSSILAGAVLTGCCMSVLQPIINSEFGCGKKFFRRLQKQALRKLPDYSSHKVIFYRSRIPAGFLFYNHLFSPVTRVENLRETLKKFPGTRVLLLVKADKELQQKFKEECAALNIRLTHPVLSAGNSRWAFCCSGEAHYSAFSAVVPGTGKNLKPLRRP
ncbi:MAG: glycosyltransferase family 39 protein [Lentisphaeria bacterium]|nr:glycosyltransferase family 39 protein [Lentisphaeria bacterium]